MSKPSASGFPWGMKTHLAFLIILQIAPLVGAPAFGATTVTSGVICLTRGFLFLPDTGPRALCPGVYITLDDRLAGIGALQARYGVRVEGALFEETAWNVSVRGELGATVRLPRGFFTEAAAGLGYMHTWESGVYVPTAGGGYGPGIDYAGTPFLCPSARLGLGWQAMQSPRSVRFLLSYEIVFAVAPWLMWSNTLMSGWSLSIGFAGRQGEQR
jgi:hypothetical protein